MQRHTSVICWCTDGQFRACTECGRSDFDESYHSTKLSVTERSLGVLRRTKQLKTDGGWRHVIFNFNSQYETHLCCLFI